MKGPVECKPHAVPAKQAHAPAPGQATMRIKPKPRSPRRRARAFLRGAEQGSALVKIALILPMLLLPTAMLVLGVTMNR